MPVPSHATDADILDMFPRLADLGASSFGEDAYTLGDTLAELIADAPHGWSDAFKSQTINELKILLACRDEDIARASLTLISLNPTMEVEAHLDRNFPFHIKTTDDLKTELGFTDEDLDGVAFVSISTNPLGFMEDHPDWGQFPSLRAFWSATLHAFENQAESPAHDKPPGGYILQNHVDLPEGYIEHRLTEEKLSSVSFFTSKDEAERDIHQTLIDRSDEIQNWLKQSVDGAKKVVEGFITVSSAIIVEGPDLIYKHAQRIRVFIVKKDYNGMSYYVHSIKLYHGYRTLPSLTSPGLLKTIFTKIKKLLPQRPHSAASR